MNLDRLIAEAMDEAGIVRNRENYAALRRLVERSIDQSKASQMVTELRFMGTGGCSCGTKSPELEYHSQFCRYRIVSEAAKLLEKL